MNRIVLLYCSVGGGSMGKCKCCSLFIAIYPAVTSYVFVMPLRDHCFPRTALPQNIISDWPQNPPPLLEGAPDCEGMLEFAQCKFKVSRNQTCCIKLPSLFRRANSLKNHIDFQEHPFLSRKVRCLYYMHFGQRICIQILCSTQPKLNWHNRKI